VRAAKEQAPADADHDLDIGTPDLMPVDGGEYEHHDARSSQGDDAGVTVHPVAHAEAGDARRDHKPEHKSMKMLVFPEGDGGDRQHSHEHRNREAMDEADRRQRNRDLIEVPGMLHRPLFSLFRRPARSRGGENTPVRTGDTVS